MSSDALNLRAVIGFGGTVPDGLVLHPDGQTVIYPLGSTIVLRNKEDPSQQSFLQGHDDTVSCLALSPSGKYLASGQQTHMGFVANIILWDLEKLSKEHVFGLHKVKVQALAFSPDERFLASLGGEDSNSLVLWDIESLSPVCGSPTAPEFTSCLTFLSNSPSHIITGGVNNLNMWEVDLLNRKLHKSDVQLGALKRTITSIACDPRDDFMYCATKTGDVLQVNLNYKMLKERGPRKDMMPKGINCVSILPTGDLLVGGDNGDIMVLRSTGSLPKAAATKVQGGITTLAVDMLSNDGTTVGFYAGTSVSNIYYVLYNTKSGTLQVELLQTAHSRKINDIAFPFMYSAVFATASRGEIRVWNIQTCRELLRIVVPNLECHCVRFLPDGKAIISGWSDGKIRAFGPQSGKLLYVINDAHHKAVTALACTDDCSVLVSGGEEGMVRLWHLGYDSQHMLASMKDHNNTVNAIAMANGISEVVSASSDGSAIIWDITDPTRPKRHTSCFSNTLFSGAIYHPDGSQVVTCGTDRKLTYWDANDGTAIRYLDASEESQLNCLAVDLEGTAVVSGASDKLVKLWGYDDGHCYFVGKGHSGAVKQVAITPDEDVSLRKIVSVGAEGAIMIWDYEAIETNF
mmetsp:Transcript_7857/g.22457  ORF Transcript_7857/g.22457 Transcript_7857/m.22457 type:complete len:631 (+) Transcript_7857:239-2131(+)